jgi:hypothetical protein
MRHDDAHFADQELHRLTRRQLHERPTDAIAWQANIDELRALANRNQLEWSKRRPV